MIGNHKFRGVSQATGGGASCPICAVVLCKSHHGILTHLRARHKDIDNDQRYEMAREILAIAKGRTK